MGPVRPPRARVKRGRHDAERVDLPSDLNALFPYIMKGRNDSIAYYPMTIEVENLLDHIERKAGTDQAITFFQAVLLALTKILRQRPALNRYIIGRRLYQRRDVVLGFIARRQLTEDSQETNVLVRIEPQDGRGRILEKIAGRVDQAKAGSVKQDDQIISALMRLPRGLLRVVVKLLEWWDFYLDTPSFLRGVDPLHCSAYIANVGSVGLGAPYHHLFEWGTCSLFITIGRIEPKVCVGPDGQPTVRRAVDLRIALDERIADGFYDARSLELFTRYLTDPTLLEEL
ncbi:MAG: hypothetical protein LBJ44_11310 [Propionibacteriaceae bacterium]|jgi:pyruvate/2-oxoglutarate dehydrogenase complex dihydrolipoamide acyltransferase (E2) component|nr:hypothetical protein [Propionibacteriaceae bacterium]